MSKLHKKFLKFSSVGAVTTTFGLILYYILLEMLDLPLYPIYVVVWLLSVVLSYSLNTRFNYKRAFNIKELIKYCGSYLSGLLFGLLLLFLLGLANLGLTDFVLTIIVIVPRFILVFLFVDKFAFKYRSSSYK